MNRFLLACLACLAGLAAPLETPAATLPPATHTKLPNGLTVVLVENHHNPYLEMRLVVRAGTAADPAGKEGLASLAAEMMLTGTPTRGEQAIAESLEAIGATLHAEADLETSELRGSVVTLSASQRDRFLELFADVARQAAFPAESFARTRTLRVAAVQRLANQRSALADLAFALALHGDGPRARPGLGSTSSLESLARDELAAFHQRLWVPQHAVLGVAGDFDPAALMPWIEQHLGGLEWGAGVTCTAGDFPGTCATLCKDGSCVENPLARKTTAATRQHTVLLVDIADPSLNQVQWRLGEPAPVTLQDPRWAAYRIGAQVLGGDFTSRLNAVLRVREGLTYGVRFNVDYGAWESGAALVSTYVGPKDLVRSIELGREQIDAVRKAPLESSEVESFRQKIVNQFPFKFETVSATLEQFTWLAVAGMDPSWLANYVEVLSVPVPGPAEIHAALQLTSPERMVLAAVGNRDLVQALEPFGEVWVVTVDDLLATGGKNKARARAGGAEPPMEEKPGRGKARKPPSKKGK
jgi:zinc protease